MAETQHEIDELRHELQTASLTRPSNVSKAKYNKWVVAEDNQKAGTDSRLELSEMASQRESTRTEFLEAMHERTGAAREQREAAAERVREHRRQMHLRGERTKEEADEHKAVARELRLQYLRQGAQNARVYGQELRERVVEERESAQAGRRNVAIQHKMGAAERAQQFASEASRQLEEKRQRVARIREETHPQVAAKSKEHFYQRRKETAEDVRESVKDWKEEQAYRHNEHAQRAAENHAAAVTSRNNAVDNKSRLKQDRQNDASGMRNSIKEMELHREHMKLSSETRKRDNHDETFESKYVPPTQAELVTTSAYETIANAQRAELEARGGKPIVDPGRPNWNQFFGNTHHGGFFADWFSGW